MQTSYPKRVVVLLGLLNVILWACHDGATGPELVSRNVAPQHMEVPCDEYPNDPACQESYPWVGGGIEDSCDPGECFLYALRVTTGNYSYFEDEIRRMAALEGECRDLGNEGLWLWNNDLMRGFDEDVPRWDAESRRWGFLMGDHHDWNDAHYPYEVHIHIGRAARGDILETLRHELAHARGYNERDANRLMTQCA